MADHCKCPHCPQLLEIEKVVEEIDSFRKELNHKLDVIERREITLLERIGAVEVSADREHSNLWNVVNKIRERMNPTW